MRAVAAAPWRERLGQVHGDEHAAALHDALAEASAAGVELPRDPASAPRTPWDPALASAFDEHHAIVHEERVMDDVLAAHAADR